MNPVQKQLKEILELSLVLEIKGKPDIVISEITADSRKVTPGSLFIATRGTQTDGHNFIEQAITQGAVAIIAEVLPSNLKKAICYVQVADSTLFLGYVACRFFDNPSAKLRLTGITGTNGKTTTVTLLYQLFRNLGYSCGMISTIRNEVNGEILTATHTTPDAISLNRLLAMMVEKGCDYCFMEVSSHAVVQHRITGLTYAAGVFSNITHDHLDYHGTFAEYLKAKKGFFDQLPQTAVAISNKDDRNGEVMLQNTRAARKFYSLQSMADFNGRILENSLNGLHMSVDGFEVWFQLIGEFNAYNILAAYTTAICLGMEKVEVLQGLSRCEPVAGRFNQVRSDQDVTAIVDYAHTPDAIENVLETIVSLRTAGVQIITVVGAGGNRDPFKRPVMARTASRLSDRVILTSDNPRDEDPDQIIEEMKKGIEFPDQLKVITITNRKEAIKAACAFARPGDIIAILGKGHENYQEIKGIRHHFDDLEIVRELLSVTPIT
ncbi:MAG: UDP-N-acetylmuramoyl-L-alanyl-D-glutamate--2,6-diaminopimelate ligase [Bacteroidetes bacterium]|nr:UDP-N-acetylmuramoyl-L-alanyl-D-glutamate--2,6-diaminopimelate ligase [Bacteroidota bacterium]